MRLIESAGKYRVFLYSIFIASGFSGLIYESVWSHYLKLMLGHAAYAQTLVLAIFMGGMAIGAWLTGRVTQHIKNPVLLYAAVELIIGLTALVFHSIFTGTADILFMSIFPTMQSPVLISITKWSIAAILILPQSILLGTTFPLMSAGVVRLAPEITGRSLGTLYFTNSIGAAAGVLASAFIFIPAVGLPGTMMTAGIINILLALAVWLADRKTTLSFEPNKSETSDSLTGSSRLLMIAAFITGAASFLYEIAWIRMLAMVLGSTMQAFELMISAFITGLAFGGLWVRRRVDRLTNPLRFVAYVQLIMAVFALLTLPAYNYTFDLMAFFITGLNKNDAGYQIFTFVSHSLALFVMLPTTFMAGMTLPVFTSAAIKSGLGEQAIGRVYAANTIGAIVGVLAAVHFLLPLIGTQGVVVSGALLDAVLGIVLLGYAAKKYLNLESGVTAAVMTVFLAVAIAFFKIDPVNTASGVYRYGKTHLAPGFEVIFHKDGKTATIDVVRGPNGDIAINTNGKPDASVRPQQFEHGSDEVTMALAGALPLALHPQAKTAANIGIGAGMTTDALLRTDVLEYVDTVEIERAMVEGERLYESLGVHRAHTDPRSRIYIDDAKTFFSTNNLRYDIIVSEPSNPWVSGVASLFSREFYARIKNHLAEGGLFVQWLQLYESDMRNFASVFKALGAEFDDYSVYQTDDSNILIVASNGGDVESPDDWIFSQPKLRELLFRVRVENVADIRARWVGNKKLYDPVFANSVVPENSDYFPFLSLNSTRSRFLNDSANGPYELQISALPVLELLHPTMRFKGQNTTFSPYSTFQENRRVAQATHEVLVAGENGNAELLLAIKYAINVVKEYAGQCVNISGGEAQLRDAYFRVAQNTNSYLSENELQQLWARVAPKNCAAEQALMRWINLHTAVAARDGASMHALASELLRYPDVHWRVAEVEYLLLSGLLGALAADDNPAAQAFLAEFAAIIPPRLLDSFAFQIAANQLNDI